MANDTNPRPVSDTTFKTGPRAQPSGSAESVCGPPGGPVVIPTGTAYTGAVGGKNITKTVGNL